jgi:hypothetical protein
MLRKAIFALKVMIYRTEIIIFLVISKIDIKRLFVDKKEQIINESNHAYNLNLIDSNEI